MFDKLKKLYINIKKLNRTVDKYKGEAIVESLPNVAYINRAKKLMEDQKYDEAKKLLKKALEFSQDALSYKYLGKIYEKEKDFIHAVENYKMSAKLNPNDKEIWLRLGMTELYSNMPEKSLLSFEKADKRSPFNTDVYTGWGMAYMKLKKYAHARDKFIAASQISKYNYTAILLSAVMEVKLQNYDTAEEKLKFLAKVAPNESSYYEYAHLKLLKSDYDEALKYAEKSLEVNKQMLPSYFVLGEVYSLRKDLTNLESVFNKAIDNGLDDSVLRLEWGKSYVRLFEFDKAEKQFEISLSLNNEYVEAKIGLALLKAYKNDFSLLHELKEKYGSNVYIQEAIGLEYFSLNKVVDSIDMFKKALKTDINQTYNYYNLAKAYEMLNDNYKVREYYEKFTTKNPKYLPGLINYSQWLINVSDFEDAQRKLRRAEKLDKNNVNVLNMFFYVQYTLVKNNICEYNIKEAISIADRASFLGKFDYTPEKQELENILEGMQRNK